MTLNVYPACTGDDSTVTSVMTGTCKARQSVTWHHMHQQHLLLLT